MFVFVKEVIGNFDLLEEFDILKECCMELVRAKNKSLVRIGAKYKIIGIDGTGISSWYFVSSCDSATNTFIKKTLVGKGQHSVSLYGLTGINLSYEVVETIIANINLDFNTNLVIDQNIDSTNLKDLLKHQVTYMNLEMNEEDQENQEVAPINAILDLLGSKDRGLFESFILPKELLLKSHWLERLGGRVKVEAFDGDYPFYNHCSHQIWTENSRHRG